MVACSIVWLFAWLFDCLVVCLAGWLVGFDVDVEAGVDVVDVVLVDVVGWLFLEIAVDLKHQENLFLLRLLNVETCFKCTGCCCFISLNIPRL